MYTQMVPCFNREGLFLCQIWFFFFTLVTLWPLAESEEVEEGSTSQRGVEEEKRRLFESLLDTCGEPRIHVVAQASKTLQKPFKNPFEHLCGELRDVVAQASKNTPAQQPF